MSFVIILSKDIMKNIAQNSSMEIIINKVSSNKYMLYIKKLIQIK